MKQEGMSKCHICGKNIDFKIPYFDLSFSKEIVEAGAKKVLQTQEAAKICSECAEEGLSSVLHHMKIILDLDMELRKKMGMIEKSINMMDLMKEYKISGEKVGINNQYLAKCPFHDEDSSFLIDADKKEYFCFCEGLKGDIFSFVINYNRDVNKQHTTLKQAIDYLMEKFPVQ